jgi:hypothetical protein
VVLFDEGFGAVEVGDGFPGVSGCIVPNPADKILQRLLLPLDLDAAVEDTFYLVFKLSFELKRCRGRWEDTIDVVAFPAREFVDVEHGMNARHADGEL